MPDFFNRGRYFQRLNGLSAPWGRRPLDAGQQGGMPLHATIVAGIPDRMPPGLADRMPPGAAPALPPGIVSQSPMLPAALPPTAGVQLPPTAAVQANDALPADGIRLEAENVLPAPTTAFGTAPMGVQVPPGAGQMAALAAKQRPAMAATPGGPAVPATPSSQSQRPAGPAQPSRPVGPAGAPEDDAKPAGMPRQVNYMKPLASMAGGAKGGRAA